MIKGGITNENEKADWRRRCSHCLALSLAACGEENGSSTSEVMSQVGAGRRQHDSESDLDAVGESFGRSNGCSGKHEG